MNRLALILLAALILVWGANWPILKIGVHHITPLWLTVLRVLLGGLVLMLVQALRSEGLRWPARQDWPVVWSVGLLQVGGFTACMTVALLWVEAGRSAILAYTTPIWVAPAAVLLLREPLGRLGIAGVLFGMAGVVVLLNPLTFPWNDRQAVLGNGLLLLAALFWASAIVHVRGHRWQASPLALAPWQLLLGAVPLTAMALMVEGPPPLDYDATALWVLAYNIGPATAFGIWAVITVTRALPAVMSSLSFLGVPVAGLMLSAWWLGEPLGWAKITGLGLTMAGVAAVTVGKARAAMAAE